jgi:hypothetical protein
MTMRRTRSAQAGVTVATRPPTSAPGTGQLEIVASDRTPIPRPLYIVHRGRDRLPPAANELLRMLKRAG